jgi:hypothetical protein
MLSGGSIVLRHKGKSSYEGYDGRKRPTNGKVYHPLLIKKPARSAVTFSVKEDVQGCEPMKDPEFPLSPKVSRIKGV